MSISNTFYSQMLHKLKVASKDCYFFYHEKTKFIKKYMLTLDFAIGTTKKM